MPTNTIFLSLYFQLYDENGKEDISEIRITHLETEYSWIIKSENLNTVFWNDKELTGYSFLEYQEGKSVLLGKYLVEAKDRADNVSSMLIEIENPENPQAKKIELPEIKYEIETVENGKEFKIKGDNYYSIELKLLNNPELFNNSRKKFFKNDKIVISNKPLEKNSELSFRVNKDNKEIIVYFLKPVIIE
ncbi:MAG TPA: hypothetical protein PLE45_12845 [Spirochaetota bacterium]|nr:hypothetical protein [Spirochaetota bacterium]